MAIVSEMIFAVFRKITKTIEITAPTDCIMKGFFEELRLPLGALRVRRFLPLFGPFAMAVSKLAQ